MPRTTGLTHKEQRFITEYIVDWNATRAAIAGGYSPRSASKIGSELLTKPHIKAEVSKALKDQEKRTLIAADAVLKRIDRVAQKAEAAGDYSAATRANQLLGQHYKLFTDKQEISGPNGGPIEITEIRRVVVDPAK